MKKIVFVLSLIFVAGLSFSTYANNVAIDNNVKITIVEDVDDKKPCPANCSAKCCTDKKDEAKCTKTKSECCSKKAECSKSKSTDKKEAAPASNEKK